MARRYVIPIDIESASTHDDLLTVEVDLPLCIQHLGENAPLDLRTLRVTDEQGRELRAEWLPALAGTSPLLLVEWQGQERLNVSVQTGVARNAQEQSTRAHLKLDDDVLTYEIEDKPFVVYHYNTKLDDVPRPYFHPVMSPHGVAMTQMGEIPGKREAHFHHTGLWVAHQKFTMGNNWQIGPQFSRMRHNAFTTLQTGDRMARWVEQLDWLNVKGDTVLVKETRTVSVLHRQPERRAIDFDLTLQANETPITLEATPYHIIALRVVDAMLPRNGGVITNSEGQKQPPDGAVAKWIDISGTLEGKVCGGTIMNHPQNCRHPTPCLNFDNQTIGCSPTHKEPFTLKPGEPLRLRYRVYVHAGNVEDGKVAQAYEAYCQQTKARIGAPVRI